MKLITHTITHKLKSLSTQEQSKNPRSRLMRARVGDLRKQTLTPRDNRLVAQVFNCCQNLFTFWQQNYPHLSSIS